MLVAIRAETGFGPRRLSSIWTDLVTGAKSSPIADDPSSSKRKVGSYKTFNIVYVLAAIILVTVIYLALMSTNPSFDKWVKENLIPFFCASYLLVIILIWVVSVYIATKGRDVEEKERKVREAAEEKRRLEIESDRKRIEAQQTAKGLIRYTDRDGNEQWGTKREAESEKLINRICAEIEAFKPFRKYPEERLYQVQLAEYLKSKFSGVDLEQQRESARPDIVIGDIAIEVKGPTGSAELAFVMDKSPRYLKRWADMIAVLFEVNVNEQRYSEWVQDMKTHFPKVRIIRKQSTENPPSEQGESEETEAPSEN